MAHTVDSKGEKKQSPFKNYLTFQESDNFNTMRYAIIMDRVM